MPSDMPHSSYRPDCSETALQEALALQRQAFRNQGQETLAQRKAHLRNLKRLLLENREAILDAISCDYGNRSRHESLIAEVVTVASDIDHTLKSLKKWMRVQRRKIDFMLYPGAKNRVIPQAVGVVGLIIPWNFPLNLSFSGLIAAFAAGNRAMVKMSENSRHLSALLIELAPAYFTADKLQFFSETGAVGIAFSKLPFDHLMFTGSGETGRKVMAAAAENLTPVTLELGGKSPAVIDPDYPLEKAVQRLMFVKQFNAGQICTTVDYVFVHEDQLEAFVACAKEWAARHCPDIYSTDYTSVIDDRAFQRLQDTLHDAREKGAQLVPLSEQQPDPVSRKLPLTLVLHSTDAMQISQREIFGPLLMVKTYRKPREVIEYINDRPRPLALYPFSNNKTLVNLYIQNILSGGVSVNDALFHVAQHDLPFGGVGASGMGHYHGYEGFLTFSKLRPVFYQAPFSALKLLQPPYGRRADRMLDWILRLKS